MYEILLTRVFSVTMQYHFAFVAISLAMFGMTAGALIVYRFPHVFRADTVFRDLTVSAGAFSLLVLWSFLTQLSIPFRLHPSVVAVYAIALTYVVIAVPFVASGVTIALALSKFPARISRLYAADLIGAAAGCVLLIPVLSMTDAPTAALIVAACAALSAYAFARSTRSTGLRRTPLALALVLAIGASVNAWLVQRNFPIFRILYVSGAFEARPLYQKWNSYSRVRVNGDPSAVIVPTGWGLSSRLPADLRTRQLAMDIDVTAGTVMTAFDGDLSAVRHLAYDVTNIAYRIADRPNVLVVGAGGGRDVLSALYFGARHVTAVDINRDILRTVNDRFGDFTGHLDRRPDVSFVNDEARSFIARQKSPIDFLQISLIDTWAATAAGSFVLTENSLYTAEAWSLFVRHLSGNGLLSVSRWYFRDQPSEVYRLLSLARVALQDNGIDHPRDHVVVVRNMQVANRPQLPDGVGTLIVSRTSLTSAQLDKIDSVCREMDFEVMLSPRVSKDVLFERLLDPATAAIAASEYPLKIAAPTDDSPFFFNMLRFRDLANWRLLNAGKQTQNVRAVLVLAILLATTTALTTICIVAPLWMSAGLRELRGSGDLLTYFAAIGLGFMLIETSQMQRLIIVLGHPTYGLTVVLFTLLLASGLGSYVTGRWRALLEPNSRWMVFGALLIALLLFGWVTPAVVRSFAPAAIGVRIAAAVAVLAVPGVLMGMAFPIGMRVASGRAPSLSAWFWGVNGATSVLASVLAVAIALSSSISTAFWFGVACYAVAAMCLRRTQTAHA